MDKRVLVIGPVNADVMCIGNYSGDWANNHQWQAPADISFSIAGSSGYTVQDFCKFGNNTSIAANIGNDHFGKAIAEGFKALGIHTDDLLVCEGNTAVGVYWLMYGNKKRPLAYDMSSFAPWTVSEDLSDYLSYDLIHIGGYLHYPQMFFGRTTDVFKLAKKHNITTSIDTQFPLVQQGCLTPWIENMLDILPYTDVLVCDQEEARSLVAKQDLRDIANEILALGVKVVVIKQATDGSLVFGSERSFHQPMIRVGETVDSVGAGDAYGAAFMSKYILGESLDDCALFAAVAAAFTVTKAGGIAAVPSSQQVQRFIECKL